MSAYTRFNSATPLSEDQLFQVAPSIFATQAHPSRSERFRPIATIDAIRGLRAEGFLPFSASQSVSRHVDRKPFAKHMVRFRKVDGQDTLRVGDNLLEIVLTNGNDGSAAYHLDAGIFRIACLNGMIVKSKDYGGATVRHTGEAVAKVIEGTYEVLKGAERALTAPQDWGRIELSETARRAFAIGAHVERFGADSETTIEPEQLLIPRRQVDTGRDLWSTFNVIQENVITGGIQGGRRAGRRRSSTREVHGIDSNVRINKALWVMAEYLADHREQVEAA
jgi:hypothetical protein